MPNNHVSTLQLFVCIFRNFRSFGLPPLIMAKMSILNLNDTQNESHSSHQTFQRLKCDEIISLKRFLKITILP